MRYLEVMIRLATARRQFGISITPFVWDFTFQRYTDADIFMGPGFYIALGPITIDYERTNL